MTIFALGVALHAVGSNLPLHRSRAVAAASIATALAWTGLGVLTRSDVRPDSVLTVAAFGLFAWMLGREVSQRQRRTEELERRAFAAERTREERARQAVIDERIRIARELHDVVAHDMTVMTVQAAAARRTLGRGAAKAETALEAIEKAGHEALTEMRRLLGLLRTTDTGTRAPQPGLMRVGQLVSQLEEAGLPVELTVEGDARPLPPGIDLNAYRIVQESLTNALKHGGPDTTALLRLIYQPDRITLEITDDGRGAAVELAAADPHGHGLVGMRERVSLLGGDITTGPRRGGGYRVRAELPLGAL
jgi:signal transduction histidine kinase